MKGMGCLQEQGKCVVLIQFGNPSNTGIGSAEKKSGCRMKENPEGLTDRSPGYYPGLKMDKDFHPGKGGGQNPSSTPPACMPILPFPGVLPPATVP